MIVWPAMGVPARYYRPLATELRAAGAAVAVVDLRDDHVDRQRLVRRDWRPAQHALEAAGGNLVARHRGQQHQFPVASKEQIRPVAALVNQDFAGLFH